ncbi:MAG: exo-alpha-sialidase [Verrucomicrobium sp.]|nr:sialidase family protein [Verrucomicrobium sp.]
MRLLPCLLLLFATLSTAAEPLLEKADLFEAGKGGYELYRIPGMVVTAKGTVLAYCEARKNAKGDWGPIDVLMRRSTDGAKTWSEPKAVVKVEGELPMNPVAVAQNLDAPGDNTVNNAVAIVDHQSGAVHFLYCLEYMRCYYLRSDDDGLTWTAPVEITSTFEQFKPEYDWKVIATGPAHGIQVQRGKHQGRLVVPVWLSTGTGGHAHRPSVTSTVFSDDHGKTWQRGAVAVPNTEEWVYPNETVVVELADGSVMLNVRSESKNHRRIVVESPDGATKWSHPRFDEALLEPISMGSITRYSLTSAQDKNRIVFANPHNLERLDGKAAEGKSRDRRNLSLKLSYDEGKTWAFSKAVEPGYGAYSDLAVLPDGTILCLYERGRDSDEALKKSTSYAYLTVARCNLEWLTDGMDKTPAPLSKKKPGK